MKLEMLRVLFSALAYLKIRHEAKRWADWGYPLVFAVVSTWLILRYGRPGAIAGTDGLLSKMLVVCSVLPGFYIGALAAIATMNREGLDELMSDPAPTVVHKIGGKPNTIELTRRRFLTHLFAFLCFESLAVLVLCTFASLTGPSILQHFVELAVELLRGGVVFVLLLFFGQMLSVTLLGLYYLGDRLFRSY